MSAQVTMEKASQLVSCLLFAETFFKRAKRRRNCLKPVLHMGMDRSNGIPVRVEVLGGGS